MVVHVGLCLKCMHPMILGERKLILCQHCNHDKIKLLKSFNLLQEAKQYMGFIHDMYYNKQKLIGEYKMY